MNKTQLIAIGAVLLVVIAGASAFMILSNDGEDKYRSSNTDFRLSILGNADGNDYLDRDDIAKIQEMIDTDAEYSQMADANNDGKIDAKDIAFLENILEVKEYNKGKADADKRTAVINYIDVDNEISSANYPVKKYVIVNTQRQLSLSIALGIGDRVVGITNHIQTYFDENLFADFKDTPSMGTRDNPNLELLAEVNADTILSGPSTTYAKNITSTNQIPGKQLIRMASWEGANLATGALMLGFFTDADDAAESYVRWMDDLRVDIDEKLKTVDNVKATKFYLGTPTYLYAHNDGCSTALTWTGATNVGNIIQTNTAKSGISVDDNVRVQVAQTGVDVYIYGAYLYTHESSQECQDKLTDKAVSFSERFPTTNAVKNNEIYVINYDLPFVIAELLGAYIMFDDVFSTNYVESIIQEYLDRFCDVHDYQFNIDNFVQKYNATA